MSNIKRYYIGNAVYFLTTVTKERAAIFSNPAYCKIMLVTIEYFKLVLDYRLYGFCIMPEHMHILIHPYGKYNFSYIMQMIKGSFSRKLNKINGGEGHIWQRKFYDECIINPVEFVKKLEYMHNNPVKANIVSSPEEYPYSSYNHYFRTAYPANPIIEIDKLEL
ncbi:MAG: transposase [Candidatus Omnitrophica bacterium]|nr:transposase [Candidatus Omnitrophota bacterium]